MMGFVDRHLAFVSLPAHGHVNPTLPLVAELVGRGWRISYATGDRFAAQVEESGATLVPTAVRPDHGPGPAHMDAAAIAGFLTRIVDDARINLPALLPHFRDDPPQAVCYDALSITGQVLAAETAADDVALLPSLATNEHTSPFARTTAGPPPPEILTAVRERRELLAEHGLRPPSKPGMGDPASLNIVFVPREFQPGADTFDARFRFVGPSPAAREDEEGWSPPDEPVLYVALGTAFNDRPDFYRSCLEAFGDAGPVAIAVGRQVDVHDLGPVPDNIDVRPWFPQPAVLRNARAFISHAGMGSTMEALYYGVPLVCVPQMLEQEVNAARVAELGLGVHLASDAVTAAELRAAVNAATTDTVRTALDRMRTAVRQAGGAVAAADAIEARLAD
jgi:MGT family glycosyltransferase